MWPFLAFLGWSFAGVAAGLLAQILLVPILVRLLGEKNFAELSLFDIGTLCIAGGVGGVVAAMLPRPWFWLGVLALGLTLYGLAWLWIAGRGAGGKEWEIADEKLVRRRDQTPLQPTFLWRRENYNQTDAFHGYSHYFLELHDENGHLARNGYRSEREKAADETALRQLSPELRALDLTLMCRVEPLWWSVAGFGDDWTPLLCGPLDSLPATERNWWRGWIAPHFEGSSVALDPAQWRAHLESLRAAYPDFWRDTARRLVEQKRVVAQFESDPYWSWEHRLRDLEITLSQTAAPVEAMSMPTLQAAMTAALGEKGGMRSYNAEQRTGFVRLEPSQ